MQRSRAVAETSSSRARKRRSVGIGGVDVVASLVTRSNRARRRPCQKVAVTRVDGEQ